LHIDIWSADMTSFGVKLVDWGADNAWSGGDDTEHQVDKANPNQGEWVSYDIPLSEFTNLTNRSNLSQFVLVGQPTGSTTVYVDNVYFYKSTATAPSTAAPVPSHGSASVISLFSDNYTDVSVDTWRTSWSSGTLTEELIDGSAMKKYASLDFVGIEATGANSIDASGMTHLHIDIWSADITSFGVKLVDWGADNAFDGGDDTEHQVDKANPNQGEWVSYDIPLSEFSNLTNRSNLSQFILVGQPTGSTTVYVDNVYFYSSTP